MVTALQTFRDRSLNCHSRWCAGRLESRGTSQKGVATTRKASCLARCEDSTTIWLGVLQHSRQPLQGDLVALTRPPTVVARVLRRLVRDARLLQVVTQQSVTPLQLEVVLGADVQEDAVQPSEVLLAATPVHHRIEAEPAVPHVLDQFATREGNRQVNEVRRVANVR